MYFSNGHSEPRPDAIIPPPIPELFAEARNGDHLILNPAGPWWFVGARRHDEFLKRCDGRRSIENICAELQQLGIDAPAEALFQEYHYLRSLGFFRQTAKARMDEIRIVHFYLTRRCNLRCPFCFYDSSPNNRADQEPELDAETWIGLSAEIAGLNPKATISLSGGEPLVRKDLIPIIAGISANGLNIRLITNGTLLDQKTIAYLSTISGFKVQVSIDSLIPEENATTRGKGSLDKALAAARSLAANGVEVTVAATVTSINRHSTWRLKQFCDRHHMNFSTSFFFKADNRSRQNAPWLELTPEEIVESSIYNAEKLGLANTNNIKLIPGRGRQHCGIGRGQLAIHSDGTVSPCRLLLDRSHRLGHIAESSIAAILERGYRKYAGMGVDEVSCGCADCPVRYFCVGGCKAISYYTSGNLDSLPPNCRLLKKIYIESLWTSVEGSTPESLLHLLCDRRLSVSTQ